MIKAKKRILIALIILFSALFVFSSVMVINDASSRKRAVETFDELISIVEQTSASNVTHTATEDEPSADIEDAEPARDITPILEMNPECIGWIYLPDTNINYPVMHTPNDPEKYLRRGFDEKYSTAGVPFVDGRNSLDNDHIVIYGHNMRNGTMFADLKKFIEEDFLKEHPQFEFQTADGIRVYEIFSVLLVKNDDRWYFFNNALDADDYSVSVGDAVKRSFHYTGIIPKYDEKLISLSTCYGRSNDDRLIIVGREITE